MVNTDLMDKIKSNLKIYLSEFGRQTDEGNVKCVNIKNHAHGDENPSATLYDGDNSPFLRCHTCAKSYDIFDCAHFLEDLPISGPQFFTETICSLAKRFEIQVLDEEAQNDQRELYVKYRAYRNATEYITKCLQHKNVVECLKERDITKEFAEEHDIGGIDDFGTYLAHMKKQGWDEFYLQSAGLTNRTIFKKRAIIFTIHDERGRPIAFAARDLDWVKGESKFGKYQNSPNSDIYQKGHILYNVHNAKKHIDVPTYIVEGYTDVTTMKMNGIPNVTGIGSVAFTKDHINLLHRSGIRRVVLALDPDKGGTQGTRNALETLNTYGLIDEVNVLMLPTDYDPDKYIKAYNADRFASLERKTGFEWILDTMSHDADGEKVCNEAIPMVIAQPNLIKRDNMIRTLSTETGVRQDTIRNEITRLMGAQNDERKGKISKVCSALSIDLSSAQVTQNPVDVIRDALGRIKKIDKMYDRDSDLLEESISAAKSIRASCEQAKAEPTIKLVKFKRLHQAFDVFPDNQCFIAIGGKPHVGKTSYIRNIMMDIAENNEDVICYFMSIDDSRRKILQNMVAVDQDIPIKYIKRFQSIEYDRDLLEDSKRVFTTGWQKGWDNVEALSKRMIVRDSTHGTSLDVFERTLEHIKESNPNKKVVAAIDNFHLLNDYAGDSTVARNERKSNRIKELTNIYDLPIIITVELRKGDTSQPQKYTLDSIMGTSQVSYDCDVVIFVHNDMQVNKHTKLTWKDKTDRDQPIIKMIFSKNKQGDFAGDMMYEMRSHVTSMRELTWAEEAKYMEEGEGTHTWEKRVDR